VRLGRLGLAACLPRRVRVLLDLLLPVVADCGVRSNCRRRRRSRRSRLCWRRLDADGGRGARGGCKLAPC
jgi:hypothetical protein